MAINNGLIWNDKLKLYETSYNGKEIVVTPEQGENEWFEAGTPLPKQKKHKNNMSWINSIFKKKEGGSFVGNLLRSVVAQTGNQDNRTLSSYLPEVQTEIKPSSSTWLLVGGVLVGLYLIFKK